MYHVDLNLLLALDALLAEGAVTGAARRLGLSPSAMSRTLTRLPVGNGRSAARACRTRARAHTLRRRATRARPCA